MGAREVSGRMFSTSLGPIHVRVDGPTHGPAIVLIHGFAGSVHWFDRVVSSLASDYRLIRVDLFGHGCTGGDVHLEADRQSQAVIEVIEALGLTDATIAGHSFGSDVALEAAGSSSRISRVVVIDQAPDLESGHFPAGNAIMTIRLFARLARACAVPALVRWIGRHAFADGFDARTAFDNPQQSFDDFTATSPAMYRTVLIDRRRRLQNQPLDALVRTIDKPVTVIHGRGDKFYDWEPTLARYSAAGARTVLIDNAGHSPNVEQPDEVSAVLRHASRD